MTTRYKVVNNKRRSPWPHAKYFLHYPKGEIVSAYPDTIGIFVFRRRWQAEKYQEQTLWNYIGTRILRVQPIGRGVTMKCRPTDFAEQTIQILGRNKKKVLRIGQKGERNAIFPLDYRDDGTMVYDQVLVID